VIPAAYTVAPPTIGTTSASPTFERIDGATVPLALTSFTIAGGKCHTGNPYGPWVARAVNCIAAVTLYTQPLGFD